MSHVAVVFVSYLKVPEFRLEDHFVWNDSAYREFGDSLKVYVVSDVSRGHCLPDYAETVVVPLDEMPVVNGRPRFSLCKTKNAGNSRALENGADVVICTDVDMAFTALTLNRLASVRESQAIIPVYCMAESFADRKSGRQDHGCTGTVSMMADNWKRVRYDERCVGYGGDDGILLRDIERAGIQIDRSCEVSHIAHVPGDGQRTPGNGSGTCWGRDDGFNFDNFRENRKLHGIRRRR